MRYVHFHIRQSNACPLVAKKISGRQRVTSGSGLRSACLPYSHFCAATPDPFDTLGDNALRLIAGSLSTVVTLS
jgi:hypothetical protein